MLALGDSVMLGCASALSPRSTTAFASTPWSGRQIEDTVTDLNHYRKKHRLPKTVIIQVGNNGPLLYSDLVALKAALRGVPDIVVVNVRNDKSWETESNTRDHELAARLARSPTSRTGTTTRPTRCSRTERIRGRTRARSTRASSPRRCA